MKGFHNSNRCWKLMYTTFQSPFFPIMALNEALQCYSCLALGLPDVTVYTVIRKPKSCKEHFAFCILLPTRCKNAFTFDLHNCIFTLIHILIPYFAKIDSKFPLSIRNHTWQDDRH